MKLWVICAVVKTISYAVPDQHTQWFTHRICRIQAMQRLKPKPAGHTHTYQCDDELNLGARFEIMNRQTMADHTTIVPSDLSSSV